MRISVTGANGFLGRKIVEQLSADGYNHVIAWVRDPMSSCTKDSRSFDLEHAEKVSFKDSEVVIHCAAYLPNNFSDVSEAEKCLMINGIGTLKLLQAAERDGVKKFVHISTGQIYAWKGIGGEATEEDKLEQVERAAAYLISKWVGETYVRAHTGKVKTAVLRPSYIYGPGMKNSGLLHRVINSLKTMSSVDMNTIGNYNVDLVYVDDVAKFACQCALGDITGTYNVGGGTAINTQDLVRTTGGVMGLAVRMKAASFGPERCHPMLNISKARKLGYSPTSLHVGLRSYWESVK